MFGLQNLYFIPSKDAACVCMCVRGWGGGGGMLDALQLGRGSCCRARLTLLNFKSTLRIYYTEPVRTAEAQSQAK
jgi:hypothetical protein